MCHLNINHLIELKRKSQSDRIMPLSISLNEENDVWFFFLNSKPHVTSIVERFLAFVLITARKKILIYKNKWWQIDKHCRRSLTHDR